MHSTNLVLAGGWFFILLSSTIFSSDPTTAGIFKPDFCANDDQCNNVCIRGLELASRCDVNGTCVCDCSNKTATASSFNATTCGGKQPEGVSSDTCGTYCTQNYLRPFRFCNETSGKCFCTCVCPL